MNSKNVNISIKGIQIQDGEKGDISLFTEGTLKKDGKKYIVTYDESEMTGMGVTTTTLEIDGEKVSLIRNGEINN